MNLQPLFETQKILDDRIVEQHGLDGQDLLPEKLLALQVELGELANEWRGFKFWSEDREPRTCVIQKDGETANEYYQNPLLEEYVDALHFLLSIGNDIDATIDMTLTGVQATNLVRAFTSVFEEISDLSEELEFGSPIEVDEMYETLLEDFIGLGELLGFSWQQVEEAYYSKNKINHDRQATGY